MMRFDLTPIVTLATDEERRYLVARILLLCGFIVLCLWSLLRIFLPKEVATFDHTSTALTHTVSTPVATAAGTVWDAPTFGTFTKARIAITLKEDAPDLVETGSVVTAHKSYAAFLAPHTTAPLTLPYRLYAHNGTAHIVTTTEEGQRVRPVVSRAATASWERFLGATATERLPYDLQQVIDTTDAIGFAPGSLLQSKNSIFLITDTLERRAFSNERTFRALGYDFAAVHTATTPELATHVKGALLDLGATHPAYTVFADVLPSATGARFTGTHHVTVPSESYAAAAAITADVRSRTQHSSCELTKRFGRYTCTIPLADIAAFPGNIYRFTTTALRGEDIATITLTMTKRHSIENLINRLTDLRQRFTHRYE